MSLRFWQGKGNMEWMTEDSYDSQLRLVDSKKCNNSYILLIMSFPSLSSLPYMKSTGGSEVLGSGGSLL